MNFPFRKRFGRLKRKVFKEQPPKPAKDKPAELTGVTDANRAAVVYVGNSASASDYTVFLNEKGFDGKSYEGIGGIHNLCAVCYLDKEDAKTIHQGFTHPAPEAQFAGFVLRKKQDADTWLWYTTAGQWEALSADMNEQKRFFDGDVLPEAKPGTAYILEAKWQDAEGNSMNCGYRMFRNQLMAHALGGLNKKVYLNTLAAFENSRKLGYRYFETDFTLTSDDRLVVIHGWKPDDLKRFGIEYRPEYENMTYDMVRSLRIFGEPVMDVREFYQVIKAADPDYTFEVDTHVAPAKHTKKIIREFLNDFQKDEEQLKKMLIQVYNEKMYRAVDSAYHFEVFQYNIHNNTAKLDTIINFCLDNGICAVAIRAGEAREEYVHKLKNAGLYILAYTIDSDLTYAKTMLKYGADTICTNFITQQMIDEHEETFGPYPFKLVLNSDTPDAVSQYDIPAEPIENGNLEVEFSESWTNDGKTPLPECRFVREGFAFTGWMFRRRLDGSHYWCCEDGLFRLRSKFKEGTQKVPQIFQPGDALPLLDVPEDSAIVLVAVWKNVSLQSDENVLE